MVCERKGGPASHVVCEAAKLRTRVRIRLLGRCSLGERQPEGMILSVLRVPRSSAHRFQFPEEETQPGGCPNTRSKKAPEPRPAPRPGRPLPAAIRAPLRLRMAFPALKTELNQLRGLRRRPPPGPSTSRLRLHCSSPHTPVPRAGVPVGPKSLSGSSVTSPALSQPPGPGSPPATCR